ncbi:hypothetical protein QYF61_004472 [Mycteria americana]|uniref:Ig-like domain-containing protein n=1 Tax=Mycteria americana TaxID=33587 RepID=A0AAN7RRH4_MYCAM|nr:hypothetical protein QYF61_004472 [Mycteria americana]
MGLEWGALPWGLCPTEGPGLQQPLSPVSLVVFQRRTRCSASITTTPSPEPPTVRVLGKEAHGILTLSCRAYGFYPRPITVSWLKDGEVRDQDTEWGSVAPNSNGTYYTWASIEARPEEKDMYRCRVEHASLPEPVLFVWGPESNLFTIVLVVAVAILAVIAIIAGFAF